MKRHNYKGFAIDTDSLGRPYVYWADSGCNEQDYHVLLTSRDYITDTQIKPLTDYRAAKRKVDELIERGKRDFAKSWWICDDESDTQYWRRLCKEAHDAYQSERAESEAK